MQILLPIHILAGTLALLCSALAVCSEKGRRIHVVSGRAYFWCMAVIFLTAIPMSIITSNIILFLIAFFSFHLAFAGMRFARNRKGVATTLDWIAVSLMILSGFGMWILAIIFFMVAMLVAGKDKNGPAAIMFFIALGVIAVPTVFDVVSLIKALRGGTSVNRQPPPGPTYSMVPQSFAPPPPPPPPVQSYNQ